MSPNIYDGSEATSATLQDNPESAAFTMPACRGSYAHEWGEDPADEALVAEYWRASGIEVKMLHGTRASAFPDMQLIRQGKPWAFCEVKTIRRHQYRVRILREDGAPQERTETTSTPVEARLSGDLISAFRQLHASNEAHELLNIVVLVNRDPEASIDLLTQLFSSPVTPSPRTPAEKHTARLAAGLQAFRREMDLCLWTSEQPGGTLLMEGCFLSHATLRERLTAVPGLDTSKLIALDTAA